MTHRANSIAARDIASVIHPQTNLQHHQTTGPEMTQRGDGVCIYDDEGRESVSYKNHRAHETQSSGGLRRGGG